MGEGGSCWAPSPALTRAERKTSWRGGMHFRVLQMSWVLMYSGTSSSSSTTVAMMLWICIGAPRNRGLSKPALLRLDLFN